MGPHPFGEPRDKPEGKRVPEPPSCFVSIEGRKWGDPSLTAQPRLPNLSVAGSGLAEVGEPLMRATDPLAEVAASIKAALPCAAKNEELCVLLWSLRSSDRLLAADRNHG